MTKEEKFYKYFRALSEKCEGDYSLLGKLSEKYMGELETEIDEEEED